jgi:hypothetical protein
LQLVSNENHRFAHVFQSADDAVVKDGLPDMGVDSAQGIIEDVDLWRD